MRIKTVAAILPLVEKKPGPQSYSSFNLCVVVTKLLLLLFVLSVKTKNKFIVKHDVSVSLTTLTMSEELEKVASYFSCGEFVA